MYRDYKYDAHAGHILSRIYNCTKHGNRPIDNTKTAYVTLKVRFYNCTNCDQLHVKICPALPEYWQLTLYQSGLTKLHTVTFVQRRPQYIKMMKSSNAMSCHYKMKRKSLRIVALVIYQASCNDKQHNQKLQRGILFAAVHFGFPAFDRD